MGNMIFIGMHENEENGKETNIAFVFIKEVFILLCRIV